MHLICMRTCARVCVCLCVEDDADANHVHFTKLIFS